MKRFLSFTVLSIAASALFFSCQQQAGTTLLLENPTALMRVDEPVIITRIQLDELRGGIPAGKLPSFVTEAGEPVPVQYDDVNGDGLWDELVFLATLAPDSKQSLSLVFSDPGELPVIAPRTNIRFARIDGDEYIPLLSGRRLTLEEGQAGGVYQLEGPAWENDRVGFRNYFDARNGMDIFGKVTNEMILDSAGIGEDYHFKQDWGQDILRVATSLGSGSLALEIDGVLHRVAPDAEGTFELVTEGPFRSTIRFRFDNWMIDGNTYNLVHDIDIFGGKWYYESRVSLTDNPGNAKLIAGITSIDLSEKNAGETMAGSDIVTVSTFGKQAYDGENLGMAIMLDQDSYDGYEYISEKDGITDTFIVRMKLTGQDPVTFRYYACWEYSEPRFAAENYFNEFLQFEGMKKSNPILISLE